MPDIEKNREEEIKDTSLTAAVSAALAVRDARNAKALIDEGIGVISEAKEGIEDFKESFDNAREEFLTDKDNNELNSDTVIAVRATAAAIEAVAAIIEATNIRATLAGISILTSGKVNEPLDARQLKNLQKEVISTYTDNIESIAKVTALKSDMLSLSTENAKYFKEAALNIFADAMLLLAEETSLKDEDKKKLSAIANEIIATKELAPEKITEISNFLEDLMEIKEARPGPKYLASALEDIAAIINPKTQRLSDKDTLEALSEEVKALTENVEALTKIVGETPFIFAEDAEFTIEEGKEIRLDPADIKKALSNLEAVLAEELAVFTREARTEEPHQEEKNQDRPLDELKKDEVVPEAHPPTTPDPISEGMDGDPKVLGHYTASVLRRRAASPQAGIGGR